jgi:hypothetical protein
MAQVRHRRAWRPDLGPILQFRGTQGDRWRVSVLFAAAGEGEPPDLMADGVLLPIPPRHVGEIAGSTLWRFDFAVTREAVDRRVLYGFPDGERWWFALPALGGRLRLAAATGVAGRGAQGRPGMLARLNGAHRANPFHLLVQVGGQVDAAGLWNAGPELAAWTARSQRERATHPFTPGMAAEAAAYMLDAHLGAWRRPEVAGIQAALPSLMIPGDSDDGDPRDRLPETLRGSPVQTGVLGEARRCSALLQVGPEEEDRSQRSLLLDRVGVLALSVRGGPAALSDGARRGLPAALERLAGCRLLLVACSPPPLEPRLDGPGRLTGLLRGGEPMALDRWRVEGREADWLRLLRLLGDFAHRNRARIAIVSGGWGTAGLGTLRGPDHELKQLCLPWFEELPSAKAAETLERAARERESVRDGLDLEYEPFAEAGGRRLPPARGWLSLEADGTGDLLADWQLDGEPASILRWIPAVRPAS